MTRINTSDYKGDRALKLFKMGCSPEQISQILNVTRNSVYELIANAKKRAERKAEGK